MAWTSHRTRASALRAIGRGDFDTVMLEVSHPGLGNGRVSENDVFYSYCGRAIVSQFGNGQKAICGSCHADAVEAAMMKSAMMKSAMVRVGREGARNGRRRCNTMDERRME